MAANAPTTQAVETTVETLTGAAREAAIKLATLGQAVATEITVGGIAHVNATLTAIMNLQPTLKGQLEACKRANPTREVAEGLFHSHMSKLMAQVDDDAVTWKLDAPTTWLAASFKRDARAWSAYQNLITRTTSAPTLRAFVAFQERYAMGHYNGQGELTDAGTRYDTEQRELAFWQATARADLFDDYDWSGMLDADATDEDALVFYEKLAYWANAKLLKKQALLKGDTSGKAIIRNAHAKATADVAIPKAQIPRKFRGKV